MAKEEQSVSLKRFYEEAIRKTGFSVTTLRDMLIEKFGEKFELSKAKEYMTYLEEQGKDFRLQQAMNEQRRKERMKLFPHVEHNPCPVPGCKGFMVDHSTWRWVCSEGGRLHFLIANSSRISGIPIERMAEAIKKVAEQKEQKQKEELEIWRIMVNEPLPQIPPFRDDETESHSEVTTALT